MVFIMYYQTCTKIAIISQSSSSNRIKKDWNHDFQINCSKKWLWFDWDSFLSNLIGVRSQSFSNHFSTSCVLERLCFETLWAVVWRTMKRPTQVRSIMNAPNVRRHFNRALVWRNMKRHTQGRSHLHAPNVIRHLRRAVFWRSMKGPTQGRSHFVAPNVTKHLSRAVVWRRRRSKIRPT